MDAIVCGGATQASWADEMLRDITAALVRNGIDATHHIIADPGAADLTRMVEDKADAGREFFLLVPNGKGGAGPVPKFNFMIDHPLQHHDVITSNTENAVFGFVDRKHVNLKEYGFDTDARTIFFPHGGPDVIDDPLPWKERDIDVLFYGNIVFQPDRTTWAARIPSGGPMKDVFLGAVDRAIEEYEDAYVAIVAACRALSLDWRDLPRALISDMVNLIEACAQAYVRHKVISAHTGARLHVVGVAPGMFDTPPDGVTTSRKPYT